MESVLQLLLLMFGFAVIVWLVFVVPDKMAVRRNRKPWIWVLISLLFSPVLAILLLLALGTDTSAEAQS